MDAAKKLTDRVRWSISFFIADRVVDATRKDGTGSWSFVAAALLTAIAISSIETKITSYFLEKQNRWGEVFLESFDTCASVVTFISASLIVELFSEAWTKLPPLQAISVTWSFIIVISIGVKWLIPPPRESRRDGAAGGGKDSEGSEGRGDEDAEDVDADADVGSVIGPSATSASGQKNRRSITYHFT